MSLIRWALFILSDMYQEAGLSSRGKCSEEGLRLRLSRIRKQGTQRRSETTPHSITLPWVPQPFSLLISLMCVPPPWPGHSLVNVPVLSALSLKIGASFRICCVPMKLPLHIFGRRPLSPFLHGELAACRFLAQVGCTYLPFLSNQNVSS